MKKDNLEASQPINRADFGESQKTIQYLATISVCFAAIGAGTVLAWSSPALADLAPAKTANTTDMELVNISIPKNGSTKIVLTKEEEALLGSFVNLGALVFAIPAGYIAEHFGRKNSIFTSAFALLIGWTLITTATKVPMLLVGRVFGGMGLGGVCVVAPVYIGEIAENSMRATLSAYFPIFLSFGILTTFSIGSFTNYVTMSMIIAIFPIILFLTLPFMPESHVYLLKIGRSNLAQISLIRFRGNKRGYNIKAEMEMIKEEIDRSRDKSGRCTDIIFDRSNRRALIAVVGVMAFQQLCGINAVTFYTEQIFTSAGTDIKPSTAAVLMAVLQCIGCYLSMTVINKAGRKYFLVLSNIGMMIGLCGLGMFFHLQSLNIKSLSFGFLPVACSSLYIVTFTLGYGTVPFMLMHELLSPEIRGIGSGITIVVAWTVSFIITYTFPISIVMLGNYTTFYILTAINVVAILFVVTFVPETRGKTLIEIQESLAD